MFGWFGEVWGMRKIIRIDVRRVFSSHIDEKSGKPPKSFFDFLTLVIRHRFFFFVPETLNPFFLEIQKDAHRNLDRNPRRQKLIWSHMVPFGVKSDPSFWAQKQRNRVRVSSFGTAGTVYIYIYIHQDCILSVFLPSCFAYLYLLGQPGGMREELG